MKDIRNYFGAKPKNGKENGRENGSKQDSKPAGKKRPKPLVLSSDSEDEGKKEKVVQKAKQAKKRAARPVLSDSGTFKPQLNTYLLNSEIKAVLFFTFR